MPGRTRRPVRAATTLMVVAVLVASACGGSEADAETATGDNGVAGFDPGKPG